MKKIVHYEIEGKVAKAVRKILAKIKDIDMKGNYGLTDEEILEVHTYLDNVDVEEWKVQQ